MIAYYKNSVGIEPAQSQEPNCWIHVECPTKDEFNHMINDLEIPVSFINDIMDIDERPRIEFENGWYFFVLRIPVRNDNPKMPYLTAPLGIIFKDEIFLSVCYSKTDMIEDFSRYTIRKQKNYTDFFNLVLHLQLSSSVWFQKYLKQINIQIKIAEGELEKSIKNSDLQTLLQIEKCLVYFTTSLKGNDTLINRIKNIKNTTSSLDPELVEDVEIELKQALATTQIYSDILNGMTDTYASVISNNLNIIMKQLTSISIIMMIPTLIASIYGMNVPNFLENNPAGFFIIVFGSFILSIIGVFLFKKKSWF